MILNVLSSDAVVTETGMALVMKYWPAFFCWIIPMVGAVLMPVFEKFGNKFRDLMAVVFGAGAAVSALAMVPWLFSGHPPGDIRVFEWINFFGHPLEMGVLIDPLSIIICNVVAFVSFLILLYSTSYMHGDKGLTRYWFLFLYFLGSMLLLVVSNNLIQTMIGWEGVGICSYGLIGYYYRDKKEKWLGGPPPAKMYPPSHAGMKAFVVTGVGDVFILGAIFIIFNFAGTLNYTELIQTAPIWLAKMGETPGLIAITGILFLWGPIGKSAQFPLHEWLPEAMAGPTSVSALIHAATMVKAGVYLVARISPIFYIGIWYLGIGESQWFFFTIATVGAITAFLAATQALVSMELKKVLAYSTVSQIGYMMLGLGLSGFSKEAYLLGLTAGIFHLASHALFKAALFLAAGSIIHAVESIYMFDMGGLKKHMPKTYWLMLLATLSLTGIPPFSGFWSKDAVFISALVADWPLSLFALVGRAAGGILSAALTIAYSIRYISLTFRGEESEHIKHMEDEGHHLHEAPPIMWGPIAVLVALFFIVGILGLAGMVYPSLSPELFIESQMHHTLEAILPHEVAEQLVTPHISGTMKAAGFGLSGLALVIGGYFGYHYYWAKNWDPWRWVQANDLRKTAHNFLANRWYINKIYYLIFVDGLVLFGKSVHSSLEKLFFDRITPVVSGLFISLGIDLYNELETEILDEGLNNGVPNLASSIYNRAKKLQTGVLSYNIAYMAIIFVIIILLLLRYGGMN